MKFTLILIFTLFVSCSVQNKINDPASKVEVPTKTTMSFVNRIDSTQLMADIKYLSADELGGRETESTGSEMARKYILDRYEKFGLEKMDIGRIQDFTFSIGGKDWKGKNLLGKITGAKQPEKYIILTAHYDHVGIQKKEIYNGADDNASGTCALLAAAEWCTKNQPDKTVLFIAFDAEEKGLQGAKHFVKNLPIKKEDIVLNINMDMVSRNAQNEINICGTAHYPHLKAELTHLPKVTDLTVKYQHDRPIFGMGDWTYASDHGEFHKQKIPFLYLGVEDHEDYHKPTDDFENIDPTFYYKATNLLIELLLAFDNI